MTARTFVDVEGPVRAWLRADATVAAQAGTRVYIGTPKDVESIPGPWVSLFLVSDVPDPEGQTPLSRALVQLDCYGATRQAASRLAYALVTAVENLVPGTALDGTLTCQSATVTRNQWLPDTSAPIQPRYSVDVEFMVLASGQ